MKRKITHQELKSLLSYDCESGVFIWLKNMNSRARKAGEAGCKDKQGYIQIRINKKEYRAHRLAWFYINGVWPSDFIDHIDGIKDNNIISNLRVVTNSQNQMNRTHTKFNKAGFKGVSFKEKTGKYEAYIQTNGIHKNLGSYDCAEDAHNAYIKASKIDHNEFHCS